MARAAKLLVCAVAASVVAIGIAPTAHRQAAEAATKCTPGASWHYAKTIGKVVRSPRDIWGAQLLKSPGGPTYAKARSLLAPLLYATQRARKPLTSDGVYYLAFAYPTAEGSPQNYALHLADGSQIVTRHVGGPSVTIMVGRYGNERYGSCLARTQTATLADGYLPIMETSYTDRSGVVYHEESFAGRIGGARSIVSFIKLQVDASNSKVGAKIRFATLSPQRLVVDTQVSPVVPAGGSVTIYAEWIHELPLLQPIHATAFSYERARAVLVAYWQNRLAEGMQIQVPETRVEDAEKAVLEQQLVQGWRYSVGNPYEELSFAEGLDTAQVMAEYGYPESARSILQLSLTRLPERFSGWRFGERLLAEATYYELYKDRAFVNADAPALGDLLTTLASRQLANGRLQPEPLSTDLGGAVDGLPAQIVVWQGLLAMGRVWSVTGHADLAARAGEIALKLETALRSALRTNEVRLQDGSLFVPDVLDADEKPFGRITFTRAGSYWNLVMPYAFASGFFPPGRSDTNGILKYLELHGSRLVGVTRADAHIAYGRINGQGLGEVYELEASRFLADNDQPDELVLALYGMLGLGMTPDTYVSGEAISVLPVGTSYYRTMYMPPNLGANSSFLETLRLLLVHERRGPRGTPVGLDLAFSTPVAWLADGKTVGVTKARTSFGAVTYTIAHTGKTVTVDAIVPRSAPSVRLRLRLPAGERVERLSRRLSFDPKTSTVTLPRGAAHVRFVATLNH